MCEVEPMLAILEKVACACAADRSTQAEACEGVFSQIAQTTVASKTIFIQEAGEEQQQIVTSPAGSIMITSAAIRENAGKGDSFVIELLYTSPYEVLGLDQPARRLTAEAAATDCTRYEVVKNANGEIIGQVVGNGLTVKGPTKGTAKACVPMDPEIPKCIIKYPVFGFAMGTSSGNIGLPIPTTVTTDKSDQLCGEIPFGLTRADASMIWPIIRTRSMVAYAPYQGEVGKASITLNLKSKQEFSSSMMSAFKDSVATAISIEGVSADDIVITGVTNQPPPPLLRSWVSPVPSKLSC